MCCWAVSVHGQIGGTALGAAGTAVEFGGDVDVVDAILTVTAVLRADLAPVAAEEVD